LHAARTSVFAALKNTSGLDLRGTRLQRRFVVVQLTLSLPLLIAAGWYLAGLRQLTTTAPEFAADRVLGVTVDLGLRGYTTQQADALLTAARTRIASLPGVQGAAFATNVPYFSGNSAAYPVSPRPLSASLRAALPPGAFLASSETSTIDPDYLRLMRIPIVRGRGIESTDHAGAPAVAVVSEDFARRAWPGADPLGKPLYALVRKDSTYIDVAATVVGVSRPAVRSVFSEVQLQVYVARQQFPEARASTLVVGTSVPAAELLTDVRRELERLDAQLPLRQLATFERRIFDASDIERKVARYSLLAGLLVLLMASVGVYAVIAFNVAQRTREIGIRMALGARGSQVAAGYVRHGLRLALFGLLIGVPATLLLRLGFSDLLYNLEATTEMFAVVAVAMTLIGVVALASWLPARRAAAVNPVDALRTE
ncbi:MAG TPA: FtsX-like permease family protein, partial [Longimicrobiales bacterium]|nr:FtsX-like permease family protein [Longimicrobiales bacterium]